MAILWIGLVAGTLDITDNLVFNQLRGITPWRVFQYIASVGGARGTAALHDCLIWTGIFYAVARKFAVVTRRPFCLVCCTVASFI